MSSIDSQVLVSHGPAGYEPLTLAAAGSGRGGFALVALLVAVGAFVMAGGMADAFRAALAVAAGLLTAMLRVAGVGVVAIVVLGLLLLL